MNVHFIISPSSYHGDPIQYRRHRLTKYLLDRHDTEKVIWICPEEISIKNFRKRIYCEILEENLVEIRIIDYKGMIRNNNIFLNRIIKKIKICYQLDKRNDFYLWYTYPAFSGFANSRIWSKIIYDCSDLWSKVDNAQKYTFKNKLKNKLITRTENKIIKQAHCCFATSKFLHEYLSSRHDRVYLIENGVDFQLFEKYRNLYKTNRAPIIGFIGGLKPWKVDFRLLLELAINRQDWSFIIAGPIYGELTKDIKLLFQQPNVNYISFVRPDKVPEFIQSFDVGLLPYLENEYNKAVFPLKFYEYLAAGVPVVGCGLPSTLNFVDENVFLHVNSRVQDVIYACELLIARRYEHIEKRKGLARQADWKKKFELMWSALHH